MTDTELRVWKAARLAALLDAQDAGLLDDRTLQEIADALADCGPTGAPVNRSTILRDLRLLPQVRALRAILRQRLANAP